MLGGVEASVERCWLREASPVLTAGWPVPCDLRVESGQNRGAGAGACLGTAHVSSPSKIYRWQIST